MTHTTILTGASRGIGAAIAEIFLTNPANNLVAIARSKPALEKLVSTYGDRVGIVVGDACDKKVVSEAVELAVSKFGNINSIILNAGMLSPVAPIAEADVDAWKQLFDLNFFSVVELIKQSLPYLKATKGNIVAVLSGASTSAYNAWGAYNTSKAALNHLIKCVATEEKDISAISVAPGVVNTEMQSDIRDSFGKKMTPEALQKFLDLHKNDQLLPPQVPAAVYVNLAVNGWDSSIDGEYLRYNDAKLEKYQLA